MRCPVTQSLSLEPVRRWPVHPALAAFHPWVAEWFEATHGSPTPCQVEAWRALAARPAGNLLVAAPTGSGKTLAAFLTAIDGLVREAACGALPAAVRVLYVSPLRALGNDIRQGLELPLAALAARARDEGAPDPGIRVAVRSGDTPAAERTALRRRPPHLLVTTPESLYILLTSAAGRSAMAWVHTVIVDELHATAGTKRGAHLALTLERLQAVCRTPPVRIGLSATQGPIGAMARLLSGRAPDGTERPCRIVDLGHARARDLAIELPDEPLSAVLSSAGWDSLCARLAGLIAAERATLVFANTRRLAERIAHALSERLGPEAVAAHHGSLAPEQRLAAEAGLRSGALRVVVATASLELGIDVGHVDLVCQIGATRRIGTFLQRAGRAGHAVRGLPKARLFPLSRDDLAECIALIDATAAGEIDAIEIPEAPLDVLAQQCVASIACEAMTAAALFQRMRAAEPYHQLTRARFDAVLAMLVHGFSTRRGRRGGWLCHDLVSDELRARRGTRRVAVESGGAIPDTAQWEVRVLPEELLIGTLDEDFAIETAIGEVFQLANAAWRLVRAADGVLFVEDAAGQSPGIPFWFGEAPARTPELSRALWRLRAEVAAGLARCGSAGAGPVADASLHALTRQIGRRPGIGLAAARQLVEYYAAGFAVLGALPTGATLIAERFFDDSGGMQLVVHCPLGSRVNRAFGLALRKRFCRSFNFELQAAATEDAVILSLTEVHSFPLAALWQFLDPASLEDVLVQALLDAPMFGARWRWNAVCALALPRRQGGERIAPRIQRMRAEDLIAAVFPDQLACLENLSGPREIPEHPLVEQTLHDCLTEAMDYPRFEALVRALRAGQLTLIERDLPEPSPLAAEILTASPYAFLDDAPLEERRTLAVTTRRFVDARTVPDLAHLDDAAIARVCDAAWPQVGSAADLKEALLLCGLITAGEVAAAGWSAWLEALADSGRALALAGSDGIRRWVALERWHEARAALEADWPLPPGLAALAAAGSMAEPPLEPHAARAGLLRDRLAIAGPVTVSTLVALLGWSDRAVAEGLLALEVSGQVLRGRFTVAATAEQWCDRRLLARIQLVTRERLRVPESRPAGPIGRQSRRASLTMPGLQSRPVYPEPPP
jgi:ATP-dependent Lhr-like helicase